MTPILAPDLSSFAEAWEHPHWPRDLHAQPARCKHPDDARRLVSETSPNGNTSYFIRCIACRQRGPKRSKPALARERFEVVGTARRGSGQITHYKNFVGAPRKPRDRRKKRL